MEITETHYIFENDDDFVENMLKKEKDIHRNENGGGYFNIAFNSAYDDAIKSNKKFYIKDKDSKIMRRRVVTSGTCSLNVPHLDDLYEARERLKARGIKI